MWKLLSGTEHKFNPRRNTEQTTNQATIIMAWVFFFTLQSSACVWDVYIKAHFENEFSCVKGVSKFELFEFSSETVCNIDIRQIHIKY